MKKKNYTISSGNVFADLGYANAEEKLAKAELTHKINKIIQRKKFTQISAAKLLDITQSQLLALHKGKLSHFTYVQLSHFLHILAHNT